ncbi:MAG: ABC transporter substrate-binding protein [Acidobacteriota bacterium]|nr:ABC transporter substrate-binding protein [Acidobacteriota bacterium]
MRRIRHSARASKPGLILFLLLSCSLFADPAEGVTVKDAAGRTVHLGALPKRIIAVGEGPYILAHLMYLFPEGRERLLGMEQRGPIATEFIPLIDPDFPFDKKFLAMNPGPEQIAPFKPDLVITRGTKVDARALALNRIGIPIVFLDTEDFEGYAGDLRILGQVLGNPNRAEELVAFFRERQEAVARGLADLAASDKPRLLMAMVIPRGERIAVQVPARSWLQTRMALAAGAHPVWTDTAQPVSGWTVVNLEQIALWNPDRIDLIVWHSLEPAKILADFKADPRWAALKAVRAGEIRIFPADAYGWDLPDPRWILGLQWLAAGLYPKRFPGFDIDRELETFFGRLYGMDKAAVASRIRPLIRMKLK